MGISKYIVLILLLMGLVFGSLVYITWKNQSKFPDYPDTSPNLTKKIEDTQVKVKKTIPTNISCSPLKSCPIIGVQFSSKGAMSQYCSNDGFCVTEIFPVNCVSNDDCPSGYCERDDLNPENTKCRQ